MNFGKICRICLKDGSMKSIFALGKNNGSLRVSCSDMMICCASVTISQEDGLPHQVCTSCFKSLCSAYEFRLLCEKSFSYLLEYRLKHSSIKIENSEDLPAIHNSTDSFNGIKIENDFNSDFPSYHDCVKNENLDEEQLSAIQHSHSEDEIDNSDVTLTFPPKRIKKNKEKKEHKKKIKTEKRKKNLEGLAVKYIKGTGFQCSFCPKVFKRSSRLSTHQDFHMGIKRYFCEICKKSYRSEKDHVSMHRRGFKFQCEICSKYFNTKAKLTIHAETHNENRVKIVCGLNGCTKVFMTAVGVDRHRAFHDGLKNIICHLCSKSFIDKYLLETHLRSHYKERRYPCSYCDKRFIQPSARKAHERRHTNTKNYHCTLCSKSFICSSVLKRHLLSHNKTKHESCRFCSKKFSRLDNRKRHEAVMHGVSDNSDEKAL